MYLIEFKPKALKALKSLPKPEAKKIWVKIQNLQMGLIGDIKN